jgi:hypothetical protein
VIHFADAIDEGVVGTLYITHFTGAFNHGDDGGSGFFLSDNSYDPSKAIAAKQVVQHGRRVPWDLPKDDPWKAIAPESTEPSKELMYGTQFEEKDARRAFPCFDEPVFKTLVNVSITVPGKYCTVLYTVLILYSYSYCTHTRLILYYTHTVSITVPAGRNLTALSNFREQGPAVVDSASGTETTHFATSKHPMSRCSTLYTHSICGHICPGEYCTVLYTVLILYCILYSYCTHTVLILYSCYTHTILILYSCYPHTVLVLFSYCTRTVLILYSYCTHTILILYSYYTHSILILYSYYTHTILILYHTIRTSYTHTILIRTSYTHLLYAPPMYSYLVAFAIGRFDYSEATDQGVRFRVYTPPGKAAYGEWALNFSIKGEMMRVHCTHTLYSHTVLIHCTHTLYSYTVLSTSRSKWWSMHFTVCTMHYALCTMHYTQTLYSHTVLIHCTHTLYSYTALNFSIKGTALHCILYTVYCILYSYCTRTVLIHCTHTLHSYTVLILNFSIKVVEFYSSSWALPYSEMNDKMDQVEAINRLYY